MHMYLPIYIHIYTRQGHRESANCFALYNNHSTAHTHTHILYIYVNIYDCVVRYVTLNGTFMSAPVFMC